MKVLLFGKNGQLGWELRRALIPPSEVKALDFEDVDLANRDALIQCMRDFWPDVTINAAAYTDVDGAETERERAFSINADAPAVMAEESRRAGALLIHYSTDYVFDGAKGAPYVEDDTPKPVNAYGESKLAGEQSIQDVAGKYLIFRTSWLYSMRGNSFVNKVLSWARQGDVLRIVDDQIANPTWARTLAQLTAQVLRPGTDQARERTGLYHVAGGGYASRYDWAKEILSLDPKLGEQKAKELQRAATVEYPTPARRPLFSALDCQRFTEVFGLAVPPWADELKKALGTTSDG